MQSNTDSKKTVCVHVFVFQSALQSSPWGLMQTLEQQVEELKLDTNDGSCDGAQGDTSGSQPSFGTFTVVNLSFRYGSFMHVLNCKGVNFLMY